MMNPEIKAKWVNALRNDPEYIQDSISGLLKSDCGYCCLGVLCDLYAKEGNEKWICFRDDRFEFDGEEEYLPSSVLEWAGMSAYDPEVNCEGEYTTLSNLNDCGCSFKTLADLIEAQL